MTAKRSPPVWRRYLRFWGSNVSADVDDELRFHVEMRTQEYVARGMTPDEARRLAAERFGSVDNARADCIDIQVTHAHARNRTQLASNIRQDVAFAARVLKRQPLPTIVAAVYIALGVGATTAMFSIGNTLLLRPLPYPNGERLAVIQSAHGSERRSGATVSSLADIVDWRARQHSFTRIAAVGQSAFTVASGTPIRVAGAVATSNLFATLGVSAEAGRVFDDEEDVPGGPPVALVSHGFAERQLGGAASIVGRRIRIAGARRTIVGVIPDRWSYPATTDVWLPLARNPLNESRGNRNLEAIAELRPGISVEAANRDLAAIGAQLQRENREGDADVMPFAEPLRERFVGAARPALVALAFATILILVVGCANVAALQLARSTARSREICVRAAIGAERGRILGQLLTESVVLASVGGVAGVAVAFAVRNVVAAAILTGAPPWMTFDIDGRALAFAAVACSIAAISFGLAPAVRLTRIDPAAALNGARGVFGVDRGRLQRAFVVVEIALSVVLVIGAELAVQSVVRLANVPLGFDARHVITFRIGMQGQRYDSAAERARVMAVLEAGVAALPQVESVSATTYAPAAGCCSQFGTTIADHPLPPGQQLMVTGNIVLPGFFSTMRIPLVAGRDFSAADDAHAPRVVVINQTFAKQFWPGGDALGYLIDTGGGMAAIIGIVGDIRQGRLIDAPEPQFYRAYAQDSWTSMTFVARTRDASPALLATALRTVARDIDPVALPISRVTPLQQVIDDSIAPKKLLGTLLAAFAIVALALAAIGVYATMSFFVSQRMQEMGLRVALGAEPSLVAGLVLRQAGVLALAGGVAGLVAGAMAARMLATVLFGVSASNIALYIVAVATLSVAAIAASAGPARRAGRVDPMTALRAE